MRALTLTVVCCAFLALAQTARHILVGRQSSFREVLRKVEPIKVPRTILGDINASIGTSYLGPIFLMDGFLREDCAILIFSQVGWIAQFDFAKNLILQVDTEAGEMVNSTLQSVESTLFWQPQGVAIVKSCGAWLRHRHHALVRLSYTGYGAADVALMRADGPSDSGSESDASAGKVSPAKPPGLSICTVLKGVAPEHLSLWIQYHLALGFSRFIIYVNQPWSEFIGQPGFEAHVAQWWRSGVLTLLDYEGLYWYPACAGSDCTSWHLTQTTALNSCQIRFRDHVSHFAFIDVDEFIYSTLPLRQLISMPGFRCKLLAATWVVNPRGLPSMDLQGLAQAEFLMVGVKVNLTGDPHSFFRHKMIAQSHVLRVVGVHGTLETHMDLNGGSNQDNPCPSRFERIDASLEIEPSVAGFLHVLSPSLEAARPLQEGHKNSRDKHVIIEEIMSSSLRHHTTLLAQSLAVAAGRAAPKPLTGKR